MPSSRKFYIDCSNSSPANRILCVNSSFRILLACFEKKTITRSALSPKIHNLKYKTSLLFLIIPYLFDLLVFPLRHVMWYYILLVLFEIEVSVSDFIKYYDFLSCTCEKKIILFSDRTSSGAVYPCGRVPHPSMRCSSFYKIVMSIVLVELILDRKKDILYFRVCARVFFLKPAAARWKK